MTTKEQLLDELIIREKNAAPPCRPALPWEIGRTANRELADLFGYCIIFIAEERSLRVHRTAGCPEIGDSECDKCEWKRP